MRGKRIKKWKKTLFETILIREKFQDPWNWNGLQSVSVNIFTIFFLIVQQTPTNKNRTEWTKNVTKLLTVSDTIWNISRIVYDGRRRISCFIFLGEHDTRLRQNVKKQHNELNIYFWLCFFLFFQECWFRRLCVVNELTFTKKKNKITVRLKQIVHTTPDSQHTSSLRKRDTQQFFFLFFFFIIIQFLPCLMSFYIFFEYCCHQNKNQKKNDSMLPRCFPFWIHSPPSNENHISLFTKNKNPKTKKKTKISITTTEKQKTTQKLFVKR